MIASLGKAASRLGERLMPDPFVLVLLLTALTAALGLLFGQSLEALPLGERASVLAKGWFAELYATGLMKFAMQMCIVLITGHALALSAPIQRMIRALTRHARTPGSAVIIVAMTSSIASLIQWGMGVIVGAFMAREMGRAFAEQGKAVHYPLLGAAGYAGFMVWHGGLSGSAPLAVAGPGHFLEASLGVIPVKDTLFGSLNLVTTSLLLIIIPLTLWALHPKDEAQMIPLAPTPATPPPPESTPQDARRTWLEHLEQGRGLSLLAGLGLGLWWLSHMSQQGAKGWNLDTINVMFLALGLLAHSSPRAYAEAIADGARGCAGIILQFPFYFGILGLLKTSGLIVQIAQAFVSISSAQSFPLWTFISAGVINMLVPSGGGQWAVQGPVMVQAIKTLGADAPTCIMALSYGDAWTNMLQPFWALPLLGIMNLKAREIIGYTSFVMLVTGPVILACLWLL